MNVILKYCFVLLALNVPYHSKAGLGETEKLWSEYATERNSAERIKTLLRLSDLVAEPSKRDSILNLAIDIAQYSLNDSLQMESYLRYFNKEEFTADSTALSYSDNMQRVALKYNSSLWNYHFYYVRASLNQDRHASDVALSDANKAFYYASLTNNEVNKIKCIILLGSCQESNNLKIDAFKNYINALYLADKYQFLNLVFVAEEKLSTYYWAILNFGKAKEYKIKQIELASRIYSNDSSRLMYLYSDLAGYYYYNDEEKQAYNITARVISYADRHNNIDLKKDALLSYRTYLFEKNKLQTISYFYTTVHPEEFRRIASQNYPLYCRLKACMAEVSGNMDSAFFYYALTENKLLEQNKSTPYYLSNFYRRFGQFLLRKGDIDLAADKMSKSYNYALSARYYPYIIEATGYLDSIYNIKQDYRTAYQYAKLNKAYADSQAIMTRSDELLRLEADNVEKEEQLMAERELAQTRRRHNIQYVSIIIIIATSFVILAMVGSFKVHRFVIQSIGFFCFILLFEFIIMLTDTRIEHVTHGEPWKVLLFKIGLIALLSPTHHWMEKKVVHYLHEHKLIDGSRLSLRRLFRRKKKSPAPAPARQVTKAEQEN